MSVTKVKTGQQLYKQQPSFDLSGCRVELLENRLLFAATSYKINVGGDALAGGWIADAWNNPSSLSNYQAAQSQVFGTDETIDVTHPSVPAGTPMELFQDARWNPNDMGQPEMQWNLPIEPGAYKVQLYFAETFEGAFDLGVRTFDVFIEGTMVLENYDIFADVGGNRGIVKTFYVNSDGNLDIDFGHKYQNPQLAGLQVTQVTSVNNKLEASVPDVSFGTVTNGTTRQATLTLSNKGTSGSITISSTNITGANPLLFSDSFVDGQNIVLAPGQSTTITISFNPDAVGNKQALLSIVNSGTGSPLLVPLTGIGKQASSIGFGKSQLQGATSSSTTSLQFGPDGRLYVAEQGGTIRVYEIDRVSANNYQVTSTDVISLIANMPNHNDDGELNPSVTGRLVTGILVAGTASNPIIYAVSSDPRIGGGPDSLDTNLDTNSGILSRITWDGTKWVKLDLVRGLPRSEENHTGNGLQLDKATNTLYIAQGGNTNAGAPSNNFVFLSEYALSAAILSVNLNMIGDTTYNLPTLDDEDRPTNNDENDPFGGNNGKNQAILVAGGPVQVYSPGYRNPYDIVLHSNGLMYVVDNGANAGWGGRPIYDGNGKITNQVSEPGDSDQDSLQAVTGPGYYGGHPNPVRANMGIKFNDSNPQSPVSTENPIEAIFSVPQSAPGALKLFPTSTNGLNEYTASNFGGALKGSLLAVGWDNKVYQLKPDGTGLALDTDKALFNSVGVIPLDVTSQGDGAIFGGTIWVADYVMNTIFIYEPNDYDHSTGELPGLDDPAFDSDGDGYLNGDEDANNTDKASAGDFPEDWDKDFTSDLLDGDDDNDDQLDTEDPFALDPQNGRGKSLPISYTWENNAPDPGGILKTGFNGLMTNKTSNYADLFDISKMTSGGAAGVLTIDQASEGTARGTTNTQENAFQFGINVTSASAPFQIHTRVVGPFAGLTPQAGQEMGLFFGNGDQDNYVQIVVSGDNGGSVQFAKEVNATFTPSGSINVSMTNVGYIDLFLVIDPTTGQVTASVQVTTNGVTGSKQTIGTVSGIPAAWFNGTNAPAVGIISTSAGPAPVFPATWDFIEVTYVGNTAPVVNAGTNQNVTLPGVANLVGTATDDGQPLGILTHTWTKTSGPGTVTFGNAAALSTTAAFSLPGTYVLRLTGQDGSLSAFSEVTIVVSGVATTGDGLLGSYFSNTDFTGTSVTRVDSTVNFDWGDNAPVSGIGADNFSARWTGQILAPVSGSVTFYTTSDDGVRLWVNGVQIINNYTNHAAEENSGTITLVAGTKYDIRLEYFEATGQAVMQLQWSATGLAKQVIPTSALFSGTATPPNGAPTGIIANAVSATSVVLSWTDASTNETGFRIERRIGSAGAFTLLGTVAANVTGYVDSTAAASTAYEYRIVAVNGSGEAASANAPVTTPAVSQVGTGLTGSYYNNRDFSGTPVVRIDATVNFDWGSGSPLAGIGADNFTVRWTGQVLASYTGTYTFFTTSDDGVRLSVNGVQIINNYTDHAAEENSGTISLVAGQKYDIVLEYYEAAGGAVMQLQWAGPNTTKQVVPAAALFPTTGTTPTAPAAPGNLAAAVISANQINLSWADNANNETGFVLERRTGAGAWALVATLAANATAYSDTTVAAVTSYEYRIKAINGSLESALVSSNVVTTPAVTPTAPVAPTNVAATSNSATQVTLAWTDASNNETGFVIERRIGTTGAFTLLTTTAANVSSYIDTTVSASTVYQYQIRAINGSGASANVQSNAVTTPAVTPVQNGLTAEYFNNRNFSGTPVTRVDATVNFDWGNNGPMAGIGADNFTVRWTGQVQALSTGTYTFFTTTDDGVRMWVNGQLIIENYTDHAATENSGAIALVVGQKYDIRIEYYEAAGGAVMQLAWSGPGVAKQIIPSAQLFSTTAPATAPAAPTGLSATALTANQIVLTWTDNANNETGFIIERRIGSGAWAQVGTAGINAVGFTDNTVVAATTYEYRVRAINGALQSADSNTATGTTPAPSAVGDGLKGEYFNNRDFTGTPVIRTDATVNFDWGNGSPMAGIGSDNYTVRWTGQLLAPFSGAYTFYTTSDDGVRLWVNGVQIINNYTDHAPQENTGTITLVAGQKYDIRLEYYEATGGAVMQLSWSNVNIPKQIIPTSALFSTTAAPAAPAQPGNLTATAISDSQVQVKWSDNSNNETGFLIERKTGAAGTWTQIGAVEFNLVSFVDQTVAVNTTYTYRVRATNAIGQSAYTDEVTLTTPAAGPVQSPFSGTSLPIPGLIEAENFDQGGQNIAWFDLDDINEGGQYRSTGVDIEVTSDSVGGGYQIGYTKAGEWLEYTINVATAGTYTLELRVAAGTGGGIMHVEFDGVDKTGAIEVVPTNWFDWKTISKTVNLSAGTQVMRLSFDTAHSAPYIANVNWMRLTPVV